MIIMIIILTTRVNNLLYYIIGIQKTSWWAYTIKITHIIILIYNFIALFTFDIFVHRLRLRHHYYE